MSTIQVIPSTNYYRRLAFWVIYTLVMIMVYDLILNRISLTSIWLAIPVGLFFYGCLSLIAKIRPALVEDELLIKLKDSKNLFSNPDLLRSLVVLAGHYGFRRMEDYQDIINAAELFMERKDGDELPATLRISLAGQQELEIHMQLLYRNIPSIGPFNEWKALKKELLEILG
ncbi:MAG: hypothetical protein IPM34_08395 [Saprospiraceae bacterium]|nr:hypothetical protein [Saprospiraceae bacterium]